ncbi:MAG: thioredoxin-disulfide reductase [Treponema sp.]|jgi:thioredoxin reductase (NADPH)|nr:thioredoxin-disulfide reductase [Treponema sp.]
MSGLDADLIIIGAGPAGLTAAQYGARANLKVLVVEQLGPGGQALVIDVLENYPGNVEQKSGYEFALAMHRQAKTFGASFLTGSVVSIKKDGHFFVGLADGKTLTAYAVIFATGSKPRQLGVPGEKEFAGKGVSYCATCDGNFFKGKKMFVVGGGDAACDEARYLSRLTDKIVLIHRRDSFRAQKALVERTMNNPNITVRFNTVIKEIKGEQKVKSVILAETTSAKVYEEETDAVFIFAGTVPQSSLVADNEIKAELDENGYVITDQNMTTNIHGLFAAGDIRSGAFRQVVTAAGDGAMAAHSAAEYIDSAGYRT